MATKKKKELFFVREMPDDYKAEIDHSKTFGKKKFEKLLKESGKKKHKKAA